MSWHLGTAIFEIKPEACKVEVVSILFLSRTPLFSVGIIPMKGCLMILSEQSKSAISVVLRALMALVVCWESVWLLITPAKQSAFAAASRVITRMAVNPAFMLAVQLLQNMFQEQKLISFSKAQRIRISFFLWKKIGIFVEALLIFYSIAQLLSGSENC